MNCESMFCLLTITGASQGLSHQPIRTCGASLSHKFFHRASGQASQMWHPVEDIAEAWKRTGSIWGRVSVVLFYFICWTTVLVNLVTVFHPVKLEAYGCPLERLHTTDLVTTYIVLMLRLWLLTIIFFFGMVARSGWTLSSTGALVLYWIANYVIHLPLFLGHHDDDDLACLNQFWQPVGHVVSGVVVFAYVFKWVDEETIKSSTLSKRESSKDE